jgi:hypothetical protein
MWLLLLLLLLPWWWLLSWCPRTPLLFLLLLLLCWCLQDPHLVPMLQMYKASGRKVFLATNSLWDYTNVVMNYLIRWEGCGGKS